MDPEKRAATAEHTSSMNAHVRQLYAKGHYREALQLAGLVPDVARAHLGELHPLVADALENVALCQHALGRTAEAEPLLRRVLALRQAAAGTRHPAYASALTNLADLLLATARHAEAEPLYQQALHIRRETLGPDDPNYAGSIHNLAELYRLTRRFAEAEPLYAQAQDIFARTLPPDHPNCIACLNNLAGLHQTVGRYASARELFEQARALCRTRFGEDTLAFAVASLNLARTHASRGAFQQAETCYRQALRAVDASAGREHPYYADALGELAGLCKDAGNYQDAERHCQDLLALLRDTGRTAVPQYATALGILAQVYRKTGNRDRAGALLDEALQLRQRALGTDHPDYAASLHNLALYFWRDQGLLDKAEPLYQKALGILEATVGRDSPLYATALDNLAELYRAMSRHPEAEPLYRESLAIRRTAVGDTHPDFASGLNNLGALYDDMGRYAAAEPLYRRALAIRRTTLGESHPHYGISLENLGCLLAAQGNPNQAWPYIRKAAEVDDRVIAQVFSIASERQKIEFMTGLMGKVFGYLSLVLRHFRHSPEVVQAALSLVFRRKGIVAESLAAQRTAVLAARHATLKDRLRDIAELRMQIAERTLAGPGAESLQAHEQRLGEWKLRLESLEAELARQVPEICLPGRSLTADHRGVASALPAGCVLVEFVRFDPCDLTAVPARGESRRKPARYLAFTLPAAEPNRVQLLDLGEVEPIDALIRAFRASITGELEGDSARDMAKSKGRPAPRGDQSGRELRLAVFDRLLPAFFGRKRLLLAPDGELTRLPFEVLPTDDGRCLIDDYCISYIGCGRDILRFQAPGQSGEPLVAADPDFDLQADASPPPQADVGHGRQSGDLRQCELSLCRLPGTRQEGEQIARMLGVRPWLQAEVLERRLKQIRSPWILHLATHGFFLADQGRDPDHTSWIGSDKMGRFAGLRLENPLLRSGLALAGGNTWLQKRQLPPEAEDGLLTAEDVTGMDLLDTELVVLSACDTGLGAIRTGEGVFGLRRAFVLAGAKTLVMSQWKVPDEETRELLVDFYRRLLAGEQRAEALRNAQLALKAKYPHPFFWGAFICQGNPGPLPPRRRWYYSPDGKKGNGPVSDAELRELILTGRLTRNGRVSVDGKTWREARHLKGVNWPLS